MSMTACEPSGDEQLVGGRKVHQAGVAPVGQWTFARGGCDILEPLQAQLIDQAAWRKKHQAAYNTRPEIASRYAPPR